MSTVIHLVVIFITASYLHIVNSLRAYTVLLLYYCNSEETVSSIKNKQMKS